jgi:hypothetical protein
MSLISQQQAVAEYWDLPNTEIFQSKDVASGTAFKITTLASGLDLLCSQKYECILK